MYIYIYILQPFKPFLQNYSEGVIQNYFLQSFYNPTEAKLPIAKILFAKFTLIETKLICSMILFAKFNHIETKLISSRILVAKCQPQLPCFIFGDALFPQFLQYLVNHK